MSTTNTGAADLSPKDRFSRVMLLNRYGGRGLRFTVAFLARESRHGGRKAGSAADQFSPATADPQDMKMSHALRRTEAPGVIFFPGRMIRAEAQAMPPRGNIRPDPP